MKKINSLQTISLSLSLATFIVGCGGGGGGTTTTSPSTYSISGTVPGTVIEAYCEDGSFYTVNSTDNNTNKHPFSLNIPNGLNCKLVMITNETASNPADYIITPIEIEADGQSSTYLTIDKDIQLGNIPLETPGINSGWTPEVRTPLKVTINGKKVHVKKVSYDPMDTDNDGILNVYENDDNDSLPNKYDNDYDNNQSNNNNNSGSTIILPLTFTANTGRLLGSQCAQCHGTNGVSSSGIDSIKGEDNLTHEIYDDDVLMNAQANGYTSTEILAIESWLNNAQ